MTRPRPVLDWIRAGGVFGTHPDDGPDDEPIETPDPADVVDEDESPEPVPEGVAEDGE